MKCFLCEKQAVVWCRNDEAALCQACDISVHAIGPLAWKHKRVPLVQAGPAEGLKMPASEPQDSELMLELDAIRDLADSQLSNAVPDEYDLPYEALVDIFPSCLGNGPKSWEINDLTQALRGDEQPELHYRPPTLDQLLDTVPDSAGRQDKERGTSAPPDMDDGPPCCQAAAATGTTTAASNSSGSREHAAHPSKQSSATTAHGTAGESMLSNFHSQALSGPAVSSPERLCHSPLVPQPCSALCAVPAAYASAASLPYLCMHGSGQLQQPGPVYPGALHARLAVSLGSSGVATQGAVPLRPPPVAAFGNVHQLHMHQLSCAGTWRMPVAGSCAGGDEAPADAAAAKAAAITAALAHETSVPAAAMGAPPPEAPLGLPNLQACTHYIPITLRPTAPDGRVAAQQQRQRQRARFAEKKRRLGSGQGVRYQSRKRYADSRPRVNGRFIRKADLAAVAGDNAADTMRAHVYLPMHVCPPHGYTGGGQAGDTMAMNALPGQSHM